MRHVVLSAGSKESTISPANGSSLRRIWVARPEEKRLSPSKCWRSDECSTEAEIAEAKKAMGAIRARATQASHR